jgi:hypothetical protein
MPSYDTNVSEALDFSRLERLSDANEMVAYFERQFELGSGKAGYFLTMLLGEGLVVGSPEVRAHLATRASDQMRYLIGAFSLLHEEALNGNGEAMHFLAHYYQSGMPPLKMAMHDMFEFWMRRARAAGFGDPQGQY